MRVRPQAGRRALHAAAERGSWRRVHLDRFGQAARCRRAGVGARRDDLSAREEFRRLGAICGEARGAEIFRSEEHTSELQSLMRSSYAVFCLKKKIRETIRHNNT